MDKDKRQTVAIGYRVTPTCRDLIKKLALKEGVNETAFIEVTMRLLARERGVSFDNNQVPRS